MNDTKELSALRQPTEPVETTEAPTPRTDAATIVFESGVPFLNCTEVVNAAFARTLERELSSAARNAATSDHLSTKEDKENARPNNKSPSSR